MIFYRFQLISIRHGPRELFVQSFSLKALLP